MIRFRVGHSWLREAPTPDGPRDAFGLELEGLNLLPGANDEPLVRIIDALVETMTHLAIDGERAGQVSLEDVHLELCFWRARGLEVSVSVIDLSQPPKQVRAPISVELTALVEATVKCARTFLKDVTQHREGIEAELVNLERHLKRLTSAVVERRPAELRGEAWSAVHSADEGLGFALRDDVGRTMAWSRKTRAGLPALLFDGELTTKDGTSANGLPFLTMMGLARAATEGAARIGSQKLEPDVVFRAGLDLCLALRQRNPALGTNPYLESLQVRCTDGLTALKQPVPDRTASVLQSPRPTPGVPLLAVGELRRVRLEPRWTRPVALGEDGGRLVLGKKLIVVHSPHAVHAFERDGSTAFRHLASRGVAVSDEGRVIAAIPERLYGFDPAFDSARWFRDHDGEHVGPVLQRFGEVGVAAMGRRTIGAFSLETGRTLWRFEPQRTQSLILSRIGHRVLAGADTGTLYGIDALDGQVRFKVKASLPVVHPPLPVRNRAIVVLNRGEHSAVYACDALSRGDTTPAGALVWTRELVLSQPSAPISARNRVWLTGSRDGQTVVISLGARGQLLFERSIPCDARTTSLIAFEGGALVTDARGAAVRIRPDGTIDWVLGSSGDELNRRVAPQLRRGTLVVPGPTTRLVDPSNGRVLAELETGARLIDLTADAKLTIAVLREPGTLETFVPGTALSIVPSSSAR